jgi:hypothetical protein
MYLDISYYVYYISKNLKYLRTLLFVVIEIYYLLSILLFMCQNTRAIFAKFVDSTYYSE